MRIVLGVGKEQEWGEDPNIEQPFKPMKLVGQVIIRDHFGEKVVSEPPYTLELSYFFCPAL